MIEFVLYVFGVAVCMKLADISRALNRIADHFDRIDKAEDEKKRVIL